MMTKSVLILGASGKIGSHSSEAFTRAGWQVRTYDRRANNLNEAAKGVAIIVNGFNPPAYHDWAHLIPRITEQVIAAARVSDSTVIIPGNVYNFGNQSGTWDETTEQLPNTLKGRIRVEMERSYRESGVRTIVLRAGNFIDPKPTDDVMRLLFLRSIASGKLTVAGDPSAMQAYCYLPDWAKAAVLLAERRESLARFEDIPFPGHGFTAMQLRQFLAVTLNRRIELSNLPWWAFSLLSPFWELAREMREMRYLWSLPHSLSAAKLQRLIPEFRATRLDVVMSAAIPPELLSRGSRKNREQAA